MAVVVGGAEAEAVAVLVGLAVPVLVPVAAAVSVAVADADGTTTRVAAAEAVAVAVMAAEREEPVEGVPVGVRLSGGDTVGDPLTLAEGLGLLEAEDDTLGLTLRVAERLRDMLALMLLVDVVDGEAPKDSEEVGLGV